MNGADVEVHTDRCAGNASALPRETVVHSPLLFFCDASFFLRGDHGAACAVAGEVAPMTTAGALYSSMVIWSYASVVVWQYGSMAVSQ